MVGGDNQCGIYHICPGPSMTCNFNTHFLPEELEGKLTKEELQSFANEVRFTSTTPFHSLYFYDFDPFSLYFSID